MTEGLRVNDLVAYKDSPGVVLGRIYRIFTNSGRVGVIDDQGRKTSYSPKNLLLTFIPSPKPGPEESAPVPPPVAEVSEEAPGLPPQEAVIPTLPPSAEEPTNLARIHPIPVFGVPANVRPVTQMPIGLYFDPQIGINWGKKGCPATKTQLEKAINVCGGMHLPVDGVLPALDPGDVVVLADGIFWIDKEWQLQQLPVPDSLSLPASTGSRVLPRPPPPWATS